MHTGVGLTERFNATLREMARAAYFDSKRQWDLYLPYIVMFYNATVQESTGFSPYFIEHGREPSLPWHLVGGEQQVAVAVVTEVGNQETGRAASAASTTKATPAWTIAGLADAMRRMAW
jgi:hypothetical protein